MATKLSARIIVTCILTILLLLFHINAEDRYKSYKVSFIWPRSLCFSLEVLCETPIKREFLIRAVLPMDVNGDVLLPYDPQNPCRDTPPMSQVFLTEEWLRSNNILDDMNTSWPNIVKYSNIIKSIRHWQKVWIQYGMCFKNSDRGYLDYFKAGLRVARDIDLLNILEQGKIEPSPFAAYPAGDIVSVLGKNIEIYCYQKGEKLYFGGIALCYGNDDNFIDCPDKFYLCPDNILERKLRFP